MKYHLLAGAALVIACAWSQPAQAQYGNNNQNQNQGRNGRQNGGGVIPLPEGVRNVISIDAHNSILATVESDDDTGSVEYKGYPIQHVYSGGIAKVLGGTVIPTEEFVSPGYNNNGGNGIGNGLMNGPTVYGPGFNQGGFNQGSQGYNPYGGNQGFNQGFNPYGGSPYGGNPGYNNPGIINQNYNNQGYRQNFQRRPRSARATRQLQQVIGLLDQTPRQVTIGR